MARILSRPASLLLIRSVAATSRTVIPSPNNSAARINIGGFRSEEDQRMPLLSISVQGLQPCFKWHGSSRIHPIAQFFKMNFESCSLFRRIILRSSQRYHRIERILPSRCASLSAIRSGMMNEQAPTFLADAA